MGHGENSLFDLPKRIQYGLSEQQKQRLEILIVDIRDRDRLDYIFGRIRPDIVFHAAAHKHVPLMEQNIEDAITNNIMGTKYLLEISKEYKVQRFVNISTDKAVNPISIMGMTKRIGEILVRNAAKDSSNPYVSVRFGNVLGSRGSVVPHFQEQIARGGPITITHPEVERFFMTIPEAVQLVLQASARGSGDEIFILDMGEQVKIIDLAKELVTLSGLEIDRDIEIVFTGLRPGEKLSEKLYSQSEIPKTTDHDKIWVISSNAEEYKITTLKEVNQLIDLAQKGEAKKAKELLIRLTSSDPRD